MKTLLIFALFLSFFIACNNPKAPSEKNDPTELDTTSIPVKEKTAVISQQDSIKASARQVLVFLKDNNYTELIKYFSPEGVLFSPYGYIDLPHSKKITPSDFLEAIERKWVLTWGSYDGTGEPIKLSVKDYLKKFVYNADYLNAEAVGYDQVLKQGNSLNNLQKIYPNTHFVDYHFSGFAQEAKGMDWTSLRLVFKKENGDYFLVAIIHDQWTV